MKLKPDCFKTVLNSADPETLKREAGCNVSASSAFIANARTHNAHAFYTGNDGLLKKS